MNLKRFAHILTAGGCALFLPLLTPGVNATPRPFPQTAPEIVLADFGFKDIGGKTHQLNEKLDGKTAKASVFFFSSTQCPISNIYSPRMIELAKSYAAKGVQFYLVNSNREDSLASVKRYATERPFPFPVIKDNGTALADHLKATHTPQAIILDSRSIVRYRGRIDDNSDRTKIIRHDVKDALEAILSGQSVLRSRTQSFGCSIFRENIATPANITLAKVTYARDVAPILMKNCTVCHRDGEAAPFPLETYSHAKTWASAIKSYTAHRQMPPWKASPGLCEFHDARVLTDKEVATLGAWADSGAEAGNLKEAPPLPVRLEGGWRLGKPDAVLFSKEAYTLTEEGQDVYRQYVLPFDNTKDVYLKGIEFQAGNRAVVHHMILYVDLKGRSLELDAQDPEPGYSVANGDGSIGIPLNQTQWVAGWAPGNTARFLPEGCAFKIPQGTHLVLQVHYHKNGAKVKDQSKIALYLTDAAKVENVVSTHAVLYPFLNLKPGVADQKITTATTLPNEVKIIGLMPHMHMLGRQIGLTAELPDGTEKPLIKIEDWDFNWQETYSFVEPPTFPKGTKIRLRATFDNTEDNPRQPSHPPRLVRWGEATTDEMCIGFFQYLVPMQKAIAQK